jgi:hypothetical protein
LELIKEWKMLVYINEKERYKDKDVLVREKCFLLNRRGLPLLTFIGITKTQHNSTVQYNTGKKQLTKGTKKGRGKTEKKNSHEIEMSHNFMSWA